MIGKLSTQDIESLPDNKEIIFRIKPIRGFNKNTSFIIHLKVCQPCKIGVVSLCVVK